ncbi:MAG: hypothetical protein WBD27_05465 [Pyrinomonadaceae bacterium]
MDFPKGDPALVMMYETEIPIEHKSKLRKEVDEIWRVFRKDVEASNFKAGAIRAANHESDGYVRTGNGYGFVFIKQEDGSWYCIDDKEK